MNYHVKSILLVLFIFCAGGLFALGSRESGASRFSDKDLSRILDSRRDVSFMAKALHSTGLDGRMNELDGFTLFVPTDAAVKKMVQQLQDAMPERPDVLSEVIKDIMVKGVYSSDELLSMGKVKTMGGITLEIEGDKRNMRIAGSDVKAEDLYGNGFVVHIVSGIIIRDIRL